MDPFAGLTGPLPPVPQQIPNVFGPKGGNPYTFANAAKPVWQSTRLAQPTIPGPTLSAPPRTLGQLVHDKVSDAVAPVTGQRFADNLAGLINYTPVGAATQGFQAGQDLRRGNLLAGSLGAAAALLSAVPAGRAEGAVLGSLPEYSRLNLPRTPNVDEMTNLSSVQNVPLAQARLGNGLQWNRFNAGDYGEPLVPGFADKPLAVQTNSGEYVLLDGNHRAALANGAGVKQMPMHVIPAAKYDPANAGVKPSSSGPSIDDLFAELQK